MARRRLIKRERFKDRKHADRLADEAFMAALWAQFGEEPFERGNLDAGRLSWLFGREVVPAEDPFDPASYEALLRIDVKRAEAAFPEVFAAECRLPMIRRRRLGRGTTRHDSARQRHGNSAEGSRTAGQGGAMRFATALSLRASCFREAVQQSSRHRLARLLPLPFRLGPARARVGPFLLRAASVRHFFSL